jgi:hypothetical protein
LYGSLEVLSNTARTKKYFEEHTTIGFEMSVVQL